MTDSNLIEENEDAGMSIERELRLLGEAAAAASELSVLLTTANEEDSGAHHRVMTYLADRFYFIKVTS